MAAEAANGPPPPSYESVLSKSTGGGRVSESSRTSTSSALGYFDVSEVAAAAAAVVSRPNGAANSSLIKPTARNDSHAQSDSESPSSSDSDSASDENDRLQGDGRQPSLDLLTIPSSRASTDGNGILPAPTPEKIPALSEMMEVIDADGVDMASSGHESGKPWPHPSRGESATAHAPAVFVGTEVVWC